MKPFTTIAVAIFALIAVMHVFRLLLGWQVTVGGTVIPMWVSVFGLAVAGVLAVMLRRENRA